MAKVYFICPKNGCENYVKKSKFAYIYEVKNSNAYHKSYLLNLKSYLVRNNWGNESGS